MKEQITDMERKVNRIVKEVFEHFHKVHLPYCRGRIGAGSDVFVEAYGNFEVAADAVKTAKQAALKVLEEKASDPACEKLANAAANSAVGDVFNQARSNGIIYIRDGTRSATAVKAYWLSCGLQR